MDVAAHRGNGRRLEGRFMDGYSLRERTSGWPGWIYAWVYAWVNGCLDLFGLRRVSPDGGSWVKVGW